MTKYLIFRNPFVEGIYPNQFVIEWPFLSILKLILCPWLRAWLVCRCYIWQCSGWSSSSTWATLAQSGTATCSYTRSCGWMCTIAMSVCSLKVKWIFSIKNYMLINIWLSWLWSSELSIFFKCTSTSLFTDGTFIKTWTIFLNILYNTL